MPDIFCKRCSHIEALARPLHHGECCPACGGVIHVRRRAAPRPTTHLWVVLRTILSVRGLLFAVAFAIIGTVPVGALATASVVMLFLGSLKLATKTMAMVGDQVAFPEVSAEELFDKNALIPALTFAALFVWLPPLLLTYAASGIWTLGSEATSQDTATTSAVPADGADELQQALALASATSAPHTATSNDPDEVLAALGTGALSDSALPQLDTAALQQAVNSSVDLRPQRRAQMSLDAPRLLALATGVFLLLWAPMALVLYLCTSSTLAMLHVRAGVAHLRHDPIGYASLCVWVLPALAVRFFVDAAVTTFAFVLAPPLLMVKAVVVLLAWAMCGLYVRQHARDFDLAIDDDDWQAAVPPPNA